MIVKTFTTAAAAIALTATPVMAQTAEIERLPAQIDAQAELLQDEEDARGPGLLLAVFALAAIIGGILILAGEDGDDEDLPTSP